MRILQKFVAEDGRQFDNKHDCEMHEKVVLPVAGLIQSKLKAHAISYSLDSAPKVFAEILVANDSLVKQILGKAPAIKSQKTRQANRVGKIKGDL